MALVIVTFEVDDELPTISPAKLAKLLIVIPEIEFEPTKLDPEIDPFHVNALLNAVPKGAIVKVPVLVMVVALI